MKSSSRRKRKTAAARAATQSGSQPASTAGGERPRPGWWNLGYAVALIAAGLAVYWPALGGPFVFDDYDLMEVASAVRATDLPVIAPSGRPLLMLSYVLNYRLSGFDPFPFHLTNVLLHGLNALILWRFLSGLLAPGRLEESVSPALRKVFIYGLPALFLTSPIATEAVAYISSRSELLATTFYLLALWVFVSPLRERSPWITAGLVFLLFGGAALSKQDKLTLPLVIVLLDYLLLSKMDWRRMRRSWPTYALFLAGVVAGLLFVVRPVLFAASAGFNLAWQPYLYTQFRMYFLYLRLLLAPVGLNADRDIAASASLGDHLSWLALILLLVLVGLAVRYRRQAPLASFGALFFFVTLAPTSSFYPLLDFAAERRVYLPAIGFYLVLVAALGWILGPGVKLIVVALAALVALYSLGTFRRSIVWSDELLLWQDTVQKSPNKERPWVWLGRVYHERKAYPQALAAWERAEPLVEPNSSAQASLLSNLGLASANLGDHRRAVEYYRRAVEIEPESPLYWGHLAVAQLRLGRDEEGWKSFEQAFKFHKGEPELLRLRGQEYYLKGRYAEAAADFRRVLALRPEDAVARNNLKAAEERLRSTGETTPQAP